MANSLFTPTEDLRIPVEYHIHTWSQIGKHIAELRTPEPLAIPSSVDGATFSDFIERMYFIEMDYGINVTLTWS